MEDLTEFQQFNMYTTRLNPAAFIAGVTDTHGFPCLVHTVYQPEFIAQNSVHGMLGKFTSHLRPAHSSFL